jgi:hypothetical protein
MQRRKKTKRKERQVVFAHVFAGALLSVSCQVSAKFATCTAYTFSFWPKAYKQYFAVEPLGAIFFANSMILQI